MQCSHWCPQDRGDFPLIRGRRPVTSVDVMTSGFAIARNADPMDFGALLTLCKKRVLVPWEKIAHDWHGRPHVFEEEACHLISELLDYSPDPKTLLLALPPSNLSYVLQCGVSNRCRLTEKVVAFYPRNPAFASPSEGPSTFPWYWAVFALLVLPIPSLAQPLSLERLHIFEEVIEQKELMRPEGDLDGYTTNCSLEALQCLYQFCRWLIFNAPRDIFATPRIVENPDTLTRNVRVLVEAVNHQLPRLPREQGNILSLPEPSWI